MTAQAEDPNFENEDDPRHLEKELLFSLFDETEIQRATEPGAGAFAYHVNFRVESSPSTVLNFHVEVTLPDGYPEAISQPELLISCEELKRRQLDDLREKMLEAISENDGDDMKAVAALNFIRENAERFTLYPNTDPCHNDGLRPAHSQSSVSTAAGASSGTAAAGVPPPTVGGTKHSFMREWVSFPCFYKDSYISGPNRFELMVDLARGRGLNITGRGVGGKPGGMVAEGLEGDMLQFMELLRTEWLETWNPRGRKLTTRLQDRYPLDGEVEKYEVAVLMKKYEETVSGSSSAAAGLAPSLDWKSLTKEKISDWVDAHDQKGLIRKKRKTHDSDLAYIAAWIAKHGKTKFQQVFLDPRPSPALAAVTTTRAGAPAPSANQVDDTGSTVLPGFLHYAFAGHPEECELPGIYYKCGKAVALGLSEACELAELEQQRLFTDFKIITEEDGGYREAGKLLNSLGAMEGFDAMFTYRFS